MLFISAARDVHEVGLMNSRLFRDFQVKISVESGDTYFCSTRSVFDKVVTFYAHLNFYAIIS